MWAGFSTPRIQTENEQRSREDGKPALFPRFVSRGLSSFQFSYFSAPFFLHLVFLSAFPPSRLRCSFSGPWKNPLAKFQGLEKGWTKDNEANEAEKRATDHTDYTEKRKSHPQISRITQISTHRLCFLRYLL